MKLMQCLTVSDIANICSSVLSLIAILVSVGIAIATLRQNSRMIEQSSRPYIAIYGEMTYFQNAHYYVVVKNYGQSAAYIESFSVKPELPTDDLKHVPFQHVAGTTMAPNQTFRAVIDVKNNQCSQYEFELIYKWGKKTYSEKMLLNVSAHFDIAMWRAQTKGKELRTISFALQDLVEKQL